MNLLNPIYLNNPEALIADAKSVKTKAEDILSLAIRAWLDPGLPIFYHPEAAFKLIVLLPKHNFHKLYARYVPNLVDSNKVIFDVHK